MPEQRPDREFLDEGLAVGGRLDLLLGRQPGPLRREVVEDVAGEVGLADRLGQRLAHLLGRDGAEPVGVLLEELGHAVDDLRPLGDRSGLPRPVRRGGVGEDGLDLGIGGEVERLTYGTGCRIDDLIRGLGGNGCGHESTLP